MKQFEYDETLCQMRTEERKKTAPLRLMIAEMDVKISEQGKALYKMHAEYEELRTQRALIAQEVERIGKRYGDKIREFITQNSKDITRQLEDVSEWALIKELRARGFSLAEGSTLTHPDKPEDFMEHLNSKLTDKSNETSEPV